MTDKVHLAVEYRPPHELKVDGRNPRRHDKKQIEQIADSMRRFGFLMPALVDQDDYIIVGQARLAAAIHLGLAQIPVIPIDHLTDDEIRAYRLADNKLAENAQWDEDFLRVEVAHLIDVNFDVTITGFSTAEIDTLLIESIGEATAERPCPAPPALEETVTRVLDQWQLGDGRVMCGDCQDRNAIAALVGEIRLALVFTDPPYNVPICGHARGARSGHSEFPMASGDWTAEQFQALLYQALSIAARVTREGGLHFVFMDWRHLQDLLAVADQVYSEQLNLIVWNKTNAGMGSLYRSQHELIGVFKCGKGKHVNNIELGKHGRHRTNVWTYPGMTAFGQGRDEALAMHPTVKPLALVADAIRDVTHRGDAVFDGFAGSGTTVLAAHQTGRVGYGMELDPRYVDVALLRFQRETGIEPVLIETGETFEAVAKRRLADTGSDRQEEVGDE